eukprot:jgi/Chrpa1/1528/Chrysochromulina_OHIO_Genome00011204-RA
MVVPKKPTQSRHSLPDNSEEIDRARSSTAALPPASDMLYAPIALRKKNSGIKKTLSVVGARSMTELAATVLSASLMSSKRLLMSVLAFSSPGYTPLWP